MFISVCTVLLVSYSLYALFVRSDAMMLTIPFALYAVFRYGYLAIEGEMNQPERILVDKPMLANLVLWALLSLCVPSCGADCWWRCGELSRVGRIPRSIGLALVLVRHVDESSYPKITRLISTNNVLPKSGVLYLLPLNAIDGMTYLRATPPFCISHRLAYLQALIRPVLFSSIGRYSTTDSDIKILQNEQR
jgi:hypothetical protein